ncbi:midnolin-like isoform X2 [Leuresthes tenuis]|uniref:midnolin-like isoform X2 n=1 Tax=Leuresthes tenuis TaxID=355514 RepID=UPI003B50C582
MERQQHRGLCSLSPPQSTGGAGVSTGQPTMRLSITSTTGSPVELSVPRGETAEGLRTRISQKLRLQTDRIVLLHKDRHLTAGKLLEQGVTDGSKLTLVPVIEAGLACSAARERTMMEMLESLTEAQINDFLSGRSPLTLNTRTGAHMMYVQLQLSAQDVKQLQQDRDSRAQSSCQLQTGLQMSGSVSHSDSASAWSSTGSNTSQTSSAYVQRSAQRPKTSLNSSSHLPPVSCHNPSSLLISHPADKPPPPSSLPHCSCPLKAATPLWSAGPSGCSARPPSPAAASTFSESDVTVEPTKQPGAVIESFVSHSPGVFSGTFSGTLAPCLQSGIRRRGIAIILQILNDLLRAASHHQGAPTPPRPLPHCCPASDLPITQFTTEEPCKARGRSPRTQRTEHSGDESQLLHTSTEENKTLQAKLERLQVLMHQRRLRRRTRRSSHLHQTTRPNRHRQHRS